VLTLDRAAGERLRSELARAGLELRGAPHARFAARADGVVATLYESGKLVVQGAGARAFAERFLGDAGDTGAPAAARAGGLSSAPLVGSDECGKGDYFGPLVVAAVRLAPEESQALAAGGVVRDSKQMGDGSALRVGAALRARFAHAVERLDPPEYNRRHPGKGGLNHLLAELHAAAIRRVARPGDRVLVDQFADRALMERALAGSGLELHQRHRAESELAVAAASIIAREEFLSALRRLSEEHAVDLAKGAGEPTDESAARFVALHGFDRLAAVAKLHFKNTAKLRARGLDSRGR
jgi:ribonuclease HIII